VIHWERRDAVGIATIDRPERRNALSAEGCDDLRDRLTRDADCRVVVIHGTGDVFCAGADLGSRFAEGEGARIEGDPFRPAFDELVEAIVTYPMPVMAAMAGPALGAGLQLALACDLRIAAPDARLGIPAARLGVHLSPGNIARVAQVAGQGVARDVFLGDRLYSGTEALTCGLVQRVADDPVAAGLEWAESIATLAPLSISGHKRALNLLAASPFGADALTEITANEREAFASADLAEGIAAFAEKRSPNFRGR
jgi:enoyl-CoA hydratase